MCNLQCALLNPKAQVLVRNVTHTVWNKHYYKNPMQTKKTTGNPGSPQVVTGVTRSVAQFPKPLDAITLHTVVSPLQEIAFNTARDTLILTEDFYQVHACHAALFSEQSENMSLLPRLGCP